MNIFKAIFGTKKEKETFQIPDYFRIVKKTYGDGTVRFHVEELRATDVSYEINEHGNDELVIKKTEWKPSYLFYSTGQYCSLDYSHSYERAARGIKDEIKHRNSLDVVQIVIL